MAPFKIEVQIPKRTVVTLAEAEAYYGQELHITEVGVFKHVGIVQGLYIHVYCFKDTDPCSTVGKAHRALPPVTVDSPGYDVYSMESKSGAGNAFLHLDHMFVDADYTEDAISLRYKKIKLSEGTTTAPTESFRQTHIERRLTTHLNEKYRDVNIEPVQPTKNYGRNTFDYTKFNMYFFFLEVGIQ